MHLIKKKYTEKAEAAGVDHRFARNSETAQDAHTKRFHDECKRVFDQQNKTLADDQELTSEEESDEDSDEDLGQAAESLEASLASKEKAKEVKELNEARVALEFKERLKRAGDGGASRAASVVSFSGKSKASGVSRVSAKSSGLASSTTSGGRRQILTITRSLMNSDGIAIERSETVKDPRVIELYLKHTTTPSYESRKIKASKSRGKSGVSGGGNDGVGALVGTKMTVNTKKLEETAAVEKKQATKFRQLQERAAMKKRNRELASRRKGNDDFGDVRQAPSTTRINKNPGVTMMHMLEESTSVFVPPWRSRNSQGYGYCYSAK